MYESSNEFGFTLPLLCAPSGVCVDAETGFVDAETGFVVASDSSPGRDWDCDGEFSPTTFSSDFSLNSLPSILKM